MASRRLALAEAKVMIYKGACLRAYNILTAGKDADRILLRMATKVLREANDAAMREEAWEPLKTISDGALFEVRIGKRYIKTAVRHVVGIICIALDAGVREELDSDALVRQLSIKED